MSIELCLLCASCLHRNGGVCGEVYGGVFDNTPPFSIPLHKAV